MYLPELNLEENDHKLLHVAETHVMDEDGHTCTRRYDEVVWENEGAMEMTPVGTRMRSRATPRNE